MCQPRGATVRALFPTQFSGSVFLILLSIYAKPFLAGNPLGAVFVTAILAIVIQYTLLELWLVPELAKVWKEIGARFGQTAPSPYRPASRCRFRSLFVQKSMARR